MKLSKLSVPNLIFNKVFRKETLDWLGSTLMRSNPGSTEPAGFPGEELRESISGRRRCEASGRFAADVLQVICAAGVGWREIRTVGPAGCAAGSFREPRAVLHTLPYKR